MALYKRIAEKRIYNFINIKYKNISQFFKLLYSNKWLFPQINKIKLQKRDLFYELC